MNYDPNTKDIPYFVCEEGMMLIQNPSWDPNGDNGKGDAIGRTCEAYMCYEDPQFIDAIKRCWLKIEDDRYKDGYYYRPQRYPTPEFYDKDFSRDHTISTFTAMKYAGEEEWIKEVGNHVRWIFREKENSLKHKRINHKMTLGLMFWIKALVGKCWAKPLFYVVNYIEVLLYWLLNKFVFLMGGIGPELTPEEYVAYNKKAYQENKKMMRRQDATKWKKFWIKLHFPTFAIHKYSWQIMSMKKSIWRRGLEKIMLGIVPRYNYVLKLMLNSKKVTKSDALSYRSMSGGRWTTTLNILNDRDVHFNPEEMLIANVQDEDILTALWNKKHPENKIEV